MTKKHCLPTAASSLPTALVIAGVALLSVVILVPLPGKRDPQESLSVKFMLTVVHAIPLLFAGYTIHCMMAGRCYLWSYAVTGIVLTWILAVVINVLDLAAVPVKTRSAHPCPKSVTLTFLSHDDVAQQRPTDPGGLYMDTSMPHMELPSGDAGQTVDDTEHFYEGGDELSEVMRRYCQTTPDAGLPPASFGSASSDMGYLLPQLDTSQF